MQLTAGVQCRAQWDLLHSHGPSALLCVDLGMLNTKLSIFLGFSSERITCFKVFLSHTFGVRCIWHDSFWLWIAFSPPRLLCEQCPQAAPNWSPVPHWCSRNSSVPTWWAQLSNINVSASWFLVLVDQEFTFCQCDKWAYAGTGGNGLPPYPLLYMHHPNVLRHMTHGDTTSLPQPSASPVHNTAGSSPGYSLNAADPANIPASKYIC